MLVYQQDWKFDGAHLALLEILFDPFKYVKNVFAAASFHTLDQEIEYDVLGVKMLKTHSFVPRVLHCQRNRDSKRTGSSSLPDATMLPVFGLGAHIRPESDLVAHRSLVHVRIRWQFQSYNEMACPRRFYGFG